MIIFQLQLLVNLILPGSKEKLMDFESNVILAEATLPGLIISLMFKENSPLTLNFILSNVYTKFNDLRKINGSKYSVLYVKTG